MRTGSQRQRGGVTVSGAGGARVDGVGGRVDDPPLQWGVGNVGGLPHQFEDWFAMTARNGRRSGAGGAEVGGVRRREQAPALRWMQKVLGDCHGVARTGSQ